jgi:hypothetical protein
MTNRFVLTSSARLEKVSFETIAAAEAFMTTCKLREESVCLSDMITDKVVFVRSFN